MHAAMLRRDNVHDHAYIEQQQVVHETCQDDELVQVGKPEQEDVSDSAPILNKTEGQAQVALVFDYAAQWLMEAERSLVRGRLTWKAFKMLPCNTSLLSSTGTRRFAVLVSTLMSLALLLLSTATRWLLFPNAHHQQGVC